MKLIQNIKHAAGVRTLFKEPEGERQCKGMNFHSAQRIGILYKDEDEPHFNQIRNYCKSLKDKYDIKSIMVIGYVDLVYKKLPVWQAQKLEYSFFTKDDVNWQMKPIRHVEPFLQEDFDMLIDLSGGNVLPLNFVLKQSRAKMKVGLKGTRAERFCDFLIEMGANPGLDKFVDQLNLYLSNPKIK
jgi:hypothetical protein